MRKSIKRGIAIVAASAMALSIVSVGNVLKSDAASITRDINNMSRRTTITLKKIVQLCLFTCAVVILNHIMV